MIDVRSRAGFTLMEAIVALVIGAMVIGLASSLGWITLRSKVEIHNRSGIVATSLQVDEVLRRDMERAGERLFSSYNLSGINVNTATINGIPSDTLTTVVAKGRAIANSTKSCNTISPPTATDCMVLFGDASSEVKVGELVVTGSPQTGSKILQITHMSSPIGRACGTDCSEERVTTTVTADTELTGRVVKGSRLDYSDGRQEFLSSPCADLSVSANPVCTELYDTVKVGNTEIKTYGRVDGTTNLYTEIKFIDVTGKFGYPQAASWTSQSGAYGIPAVKTQQINFNRYYVERKSNSSHPTLVKVTTVTRDGRWGMPEAVAYGVKKFEVYTQQKDSINLKRGTGFTPNSFVMASTNPNFVSSTVPVAGSDVKAFGFRVSYKNIASTKVVFAVESREGGSDSKNNRRNSNIRDLPMSIRVANNHLLEGGVVDPRKSDVSAASSLVSDTKVWNAAPVARMKVSINPASVGQDIRFTDNGSSDMDGFITSYTWDFGDGQSASGTSASHSYSSAGNYTAVLTVTDNGDLMGRHLIPIEVKLANVSPVANFNIPSPIKSGVRVSFVSSSSDSDGSIVSYHWAFSDGQVSISRTADVIFTTAGSASVTLTVKDDRGAVATMTRSFSVVTGNGAPSAVITAPSCASTYCQPDSSFSWDGSSSSDPENEPLSYHWDFGDGTLSESEKIVPHSFSVGGTYVVRLTVTDPQGYSASATKTVVVNGAPVVTLAGPECATTTEGCYVGQPYTFTATAYDTDGTITAQQFIIGSYSTTSATNVLNYTFPSAGSYLVRFKAQDEKGAISEAQVPVKVSVDTRPEITCPVSVSVPMRKNTSVSCSIKNKGVSSMTYGFKVTTSDTTIVSPTTPANATVGAGQTANISVSLSGGSKQGEAIVRLTGGNSGVTDYADIAVVSVPSYDFTFTYSPSHPKVTAIYLAGKTSATSAPARITLGPNTYSSLGAGLTVYILDKATMEVETRTLYATGSSTAASDNLAQLLENLPAGKFVLITSDGVWETNVTPNLESALLDMGLGYKSSLSSGAGYGVMIDSDDRYNNVEVTQVAGSTSPATIRGVFIGGKFYNWNSGMPGELMMRSVAVTNKSSVGGEIDLAFTCDSAGASQCYSMDLDGNPVTKTQHLLPDESEIILLAHRVSDEAVLGNTYNTRLVGVFNTATKSADLSYTVGYNTVSPPAELSPLGNFSDVPGAVGARTVTITNNYKYGRRFSLVSSSSNGTALSVSSGDLIYLEPFKAQVVEIQYSVPDNAVADQTATYRLAATHGGNTASSTGIFTVAGNTIAPTVIPPADFLVNSGESGTVIFTIKNNSNKTKTFSIGKGTTGVIQSAGAVTSITLGARASGPLSVTYAISPRALANSTGTLRITASDGSVSGSGTLTLTTRLVLRNPTIKPPSNFTADPGSQGKSYFIITNNSNDTRVYNLLSSRSGAVITSSVDSAMRSIKPQESVFVGVNWSVAPNAIAHSTGLFGVDAVDAGLPSSSAAASTTVTVTETRSAPTVEGNGDFMGEPGSSGQRIFYVRNNSSASRSLKFVVARSGIISSATVTATATFAPFEKKAIPVSYSISSGALAGTKGALSLTASEADLSSSATVAATATELFGVSIDSRTGYTFSSSAPNKVTHTIRNTGNSTRVFKFTDVTPRPSTGTAYLVYTLPGSVSIGAGQSLNVDFSVSLSGVSEASQNITGQVKVEDSALAPSSAVGTSTGRVALILAPPTVVALTKTIQVAPGSTGNSVYSVKNNSNSTRTIALGSPATEDFAYASPAISVLTLSPGEVRNVTVSWGMAARSIYNTESTLKLRASDGEHSANDFVTATTSLVDKSPLLKTDALRDVLPGGVYSQGMEVTNESNSARIICFSASQSSGNRSYTDVFSGEITVPACTSFNAYQTVSVVGEGARYAIKSDVLSGWTALGTVKAYLQNTPSQQGASTFTVRVQEFHPPPTITAPADIAGAPGSTYDVVYTIKNTSNVSRSFNIGYGQGGASELSTLSQLAPAGSSLSLPAFGSTSVTLRYTVSPQARSANRTVIAFSLVATSGPSGTFTNHEHEMVTTTVHRSPTLSTPADITVAQGGYYSVSRTLTNNSNVAESFTYGHSSSNYQVTSQVDVTGSCTNVAPGGICTITQTFFAGTSGTATLAAIANSGFAQGQSQLGVTVKAPLENPSVTGPESHVYTSYPNWKPDYDYQKVVITNNSASTRTFNLSANAGHFANSYDGITITQITIGAGATVNIDHVSYPISYGIINYTVTITDALAIAYSASASWTVTYKTSSCGGPGEMACPSYSRTSRNSALMDQSEQALPVPELTCQYSTVVVGQIVNCSTSTRDDDRVSFHRYEWGDGKASTIAAEENMAHGAHAYENEGKYSVAAYTISSDGITSEYKSTVLEVRPNTPPSLPSAEVVCDGSCRENKSIQISITATDGDAVLGDSVHAIYADLGDGRAAWIRGGEPLIVEYKASGSYLISFTAYDAAGVSSPKGYTTVNIAPLELAGVRCLIPQIAEQGIKTPLEMHFSSEVPIRRVVFNVQDPGGKQYPIEIPGALSGSAAVEHPFHTVGKWKVTCSVEDKDGLISQNDEFVDISPGK